MTPLPLAEVSAYSGSHSPDGLFVFSGPGVRRGQRLKGADIQDLAPTLMHIMGLPVASWTGWPGVDRRVRASRGLPGDVCEYDLLAPDPNSVGLTAEEEDAIRAELAGLGYLRD